MKKFLSRSLVLLIIDALSVPVFTNDNNSDEYYPQYEGLSKSIVKSLEVVGINSTYDNMKKIVKVKGILNYEETSA